LRSVLENEKNASVLKASIVEMGSKNEKSLHSQFTSIVVLTMGENLNLKCIRSVEICKK
jgi:hypothetical protein